MGLLIHCAFFLMLFLSSGAVLSLLRTDGAVEEGFQIDLMYSWLDVVPRFWLYFSIFSLLFYFFTLDKTKRYFFIISLMERKLLIMLFGWMLLCSALGTYPQDSLRFSIFLIVGFLVLFFELIFFSQYYLKFLIVFIYLNLVLSLIFIFLIPSYGIAVGSEHAGKWQGVFSHKNGLGSFSAFSYIFFLSQLYKRKYYHVLGIAISLILIIGSQSGTAIGAVLVVSLLYILYSFGFNKAIYRLRLLLLLLLLGVSFSSVYFANSDMIFSWMGRDSSFTGRNIIWDYVLNAVKASPIYGRGADAYVQDIYYTLGSVLFDELGFVVGSTHNGFLDVLYSFGYIGLALFVALLISLILNSEYNDKFLIIFFYIFFYIVLNTTETKMLSFNIYTLLLFWIIVTAEHKKRKKPLYR